TPANRGDEKTYLSNFVGKNYDATNAEKDAYGEDDDVTDRLDFQKEQIDKANFDLNLPLAPKINGMNDNGEKNILSQEVIKNLNNKDIDINRFDKPVKNQTDNIPMKKAIFSSILTALTITSFGMPNDSVHAEDMSQLQTQGQDIVQKD